MNIWRSSSTLAANACRIAANEGVSQYMSSLEACSEPDIGQDKAVGPCNGFSDHLAIL